MRWVGRTGAAEQDELRAERTDAGQTAELGESVLGVHRPEPTGVERPLQRSHRDAAEVLHLPADSPGKPSRSTRRDGPGNVVSHVAVDVDLRAELLRHRGLDPCRLRHADAVPDERPRRRLVGEWKFTGRSPG